jgi:hypothetical protein
MRWRKVVEKRFSTILHHARHTGHKPLNYKENDGGEYGGETKWRSGETIY